MQAVQPHRRSLLRAFDARAERLAMHATSFAGGTRALAIAVSAVVVWLLLGPLFRYSQGWQLAINSATTIVTFLMVFVLQRSQNKESRAMQMKLDELVAALEGASNRLIAVEELSEEELEVLGRHFHVLARMAKEHRDIRESHSIEEAEERHERKYRPRAASRTP